jgi:hypothetical protein
VTLARPGAVLPGAARALIPPSKLRDYVLDPEHPDGRHKARVFRSVLAIEHEHWEDLREQLLTGVQTALVVDVRVTRFGFTAEVPIVVTGHNGRTAQVTTAWYVADDDPDERPRLVTAYVDPAALKERD